MATFRKLPSGTWQAIIRKKGSNQQSKTFKSKSNAEKWARSIELQIEQGTFIDRTEAENTTIAELIDRYQAEVTPGKKGRYQEEQRLSYLRKQFGKFNAASLHSKHIAEHRDRRLKANLSAQTVIHELNLISGIFEVATKEWGLPISNPVKFIKRPPKVQGRTRRLDVGEFDRLLTELAGSKEMQCIVELAVETAMRRSEVLSLDWRDIDFVNRVITLNTTKNGDVREVPISLRAVEVLERIPRSSETVFSLKGNTVSHYFQKACKRAELLDLRFHDLRHEGVSRLFEKGLNPMEVSCVSGHKTLGCLKRYTHLKAADLAKKIG